MAEPIKLYKGEDEKTVYAQPVADELITAGWSTEKPAPKPKKEKKADDTKGDPNPASDSDTKGGDQSDDVADS